MSSQPQNDNHHSQPFDGLTPEFSSDDPLERRLLADGSRWRTHTAPAIEPFTRRVRAALRENMSRYLADTFVEERPMSQRIVTPPPITASQPPRHRPTIWGTLVAIAAAVAIVAMLAWVFQAIPHSRVASRPATATPNYAAHITHPRGHWADVVQYKVPGANDSIIVAPSDPRVAFRITRPQPTSAAVTLARTSNGGASWTTLTLPSDDGGWFGGLAVSPLDPQTVFLLLAADQSDPHCPAYALPPGADVGPAALQAASTTRASAQLGPLHPTSGGYSCSFQYVSRDGGAHWSHPTFPWQAQHLADLGVTLVSPVQAQGSMLFTAVAGDLNGEAYAGVRLVASSDGGMIWSAADSAIDATGQIVTSYAAIPGTTTLYALSVPQQTGISQVSAAEFWSSQDAGAHWSRLGTAPLAQATLIGAEVPGFGPILYATGINSGVGGASLVAYASRDGGRTWSLAPSAGLPSASGNAPPEQPMTAPNALGILDDGSLLLDFFDQVPFPEAGGALTINPTFYAWRPGDAAWFQAVPRPGSGSLTQAWTTKPANGPQTLWIVVQSPQGAIYTVRKDVLE